MGTRLSATVATAFAVLAFGLGIRVAAMAGPSEQTVGIPEWRICLTLPMFAGAVALFIVMIVRLQQLRKRHSLRAWRSLSRTERQHASRQLRGKSPIGEDELAFLRSLAVYRRDQRVLVLQHAGLALLAGGEIVSTDRIFGLMTGVFIAVLALVAVFVVRYETSNMTAFLNRHGWPVEPSPEHSG